MYAASDPRVDRLVLLNPWVRTGRLAGEAYLTTYYGRRLRDPAFWRRMLTNPVALLRGLLGYADNRRESGRTAAAPAPAFLERMLTGARAFRGRMLVVLSGADTVAAEFLALLERHPDWNDAFRHAGVSLLRIDAANHTFSRRQWRDEVAARSCGFRARVSRMLPTFIGIGAQRAGTTWAYNCLAEHPQVFMTRKKEQHFFYVNYSRGLDWYAAQFAGAGSAVARGEITPDYLYHPEALANIARDLPDARLFVILRNPIDRAVSAYALHAQRYAGQSFAQASSVTTSSSIAGVMRAIWRMSSGSFRAAAAGCSSTMTSWSARCSSCASCTNTWAWMRTSARRRCRHTTTA